MTERLDGILVRLQASDPKERCAALRDLVRGAASPTGPLLERVAELVMSESRGVNRLAALDALRLAWPSPEAVAVFRRALADEAWLADRAVTLLAGCGDPQAFALMASAFLATQATALRVAILRVFHAAPQGLLREFLTRSEVLRSPVDELRATAVAMLGRVANPTVARILLGGLSDRNARVRANTVEALAAVLPGPQAARAVLPLLGDRNNRVRANVIVVLLRLGVRKVERFLVEMATHANALFRASAAWAMGQVPGGDTRRALLERLAADADAMVSRQAGLALSRVAVTL